MRLLVASVVIAVAAIGAAPIAAADDVPGIDDDAILGAPCDNWDRYIFGRGPRGELLACVAFGGDEGEWGRSIARRSRPIVRRRSGLAARPVIP